MEDAEHYRCRLIHLKPADDPGKHAQAACDTIAGIDGILLAAPFSDHSIHVIYSLNQISFELITELLDELEFDMDDSILVSLRNTIYCYLEDNARDNMHIDITEFEETGDEDESPEISHREEQYWEDYR